MVLIGEVLEGYNVALKNIIGVKYIEVLNNGFIQCGDDVKLSQALGVILQAFYGTVDRLQVFPFQGDQG